MAVGTPGTRNENGETTRPPPAGTALSRATFADVAPAAASSSSGPRSTAGDHAEAIATSAASALIGANLAAPGQESGSTAARRAPNSGP